MKVVEKQIKELIEAEYNPRRLTKDQYKQLKDSLLRFGVVDPVLVNINEERKNIIIGGHQRTKVWSDLGNKTIPCVELNLTLDQEKELNVRLNKNTGEFDFDMLANYFEETELIEWGFESFDFDKQVNEEDFDEEFPDLGNGEDNPIKTMSFTLSNEQAEQIEEGIKKAKIELECFDDVNENSNGNALFAIIKKYINE